MADQTPEPIPSPVAPERTGGKQTKIFNEDAYRTLVWLLVGIASLLTLIGLGSVGDPTLAAGSIDIAESTKTLNDSNTAGAPQQQVVNGWYVADVLPVISEQLTGIHQAGLYTAHLFYLGFIALMGTCLDIVGRGFGRQYNQRLEAKVLDEKSS